MNFSLYRIIKHTGSFLSSYILILGYKFLFTYIHTCTHARNSFPFPNIIYKKIIIKQHTKKNLSEWEKEGEFSIRIYFFINRLELYAFLMAFLIEEKSLTFLWVLWYVVRKSIYSFTRELLNERLIFSVYICCIY